MKKREFHLGPGAASLMLVAVVLAMSILGMLSMMNARSDIAMARRSAGVAEAVAALDSASEESLAVLDGILAECAAAAADDADYLASIEQALSEGFTLQNGLVCWNETGMDGRTLECAAEIAPLGENIRLKWAVHRHWTEIPGEYADDFFDFEGDIFL